MYAEEILTIKYKGKDENREKFLDLILDTLREDTKYMNAHFEMSFSEPRELKGKELDDFKQMEFDEDD